MQNHKINDAWPLVNRKVENTVLTVSYNLIFEIEDQLVQWKFSTCNHKYLQHVVVTKYKFLVSASLCKNYGRVCYLKNFG